MATSAADLPTDPPVRSAIGLSEVPEAARALSPLDGPDYVDRFTLATTDAALATPEQWARAMFEDVLGRGAQHVWKRLLWLRLRKLPSVGTVAGWAIAGRGDGWIRLEAAGALFTSHLVVEAGDGEVSLTTFMVYRRRLGAAIWRRASAIHRGAAPDLLRDAAAVVHAQLGPEAGAGAGASAGAASPAAA